MSRPFSIVLAVFVLLGTLLASGVALAQPDCSNPRSATDSVFHWQQPGNENIAKAIQCLERAGRSTVDLERVAVRLKRVYDSRALWVEIETISEDPEWKDPETGQAAVAPHPGLPHVIVARGADGQWRWTRESLDRIDGIYEESNSYVDQMVQYMPDWLKAKLLDMAMWQYLAILLILFVGVITRKLIQVIVANRIRNFAERREQAWATSLIDVFASPGATLVMAAMMALSYQYLGLPLWAGAAINVASRLLVVVSIVWALYRLVDVLSAHMAMKAEATETKLDDQLVPLIRKTLKGLTVVAGFLFILQNLNVNVGSLLAGLGIGGVAVALAAKDTVANFFGSIMIFIDRPFQIGDWVVIDGAEGIVEEVGFRSTRIRTFYNSVITVPNAKFTEAKIDNYGAREYRRCFVTLGVTYDTTPEQMQAFVEGIRAVIQANAFTRKDYYEIHMSGFGDSSLNVMVYFFFKVASWSEELRERHNVFLEIMRVAKDVGVSFAFPTQTLHVESVAAAGVKRQVAPALPPEQLAGVVTSYGPEGKSSRPAGPKITHGFFATPAAAGSTEEADN
jgi:MscS family membrane protein